nr:hypothetical protein [Tanacetum cinerariifolium]
REHIDLDVADVSPQPSTEQLDEVFTATVYPNVQENFKLAVDEPVLLKEPASSSGTLSSLQHLSIYFSFGDQFFSDKDSDADKNAKTKVESMVNVTIQQALSSISLMTSPIIDLTSRPESPKEHQQLKATTTDTTTTTTTATLPPPQAPQQSMTEAMMVKCIGELEHIMANLIQVNKNMEVRLDKHGARLYALKQLDIPQQVSIAVSEVVTDAVDWAMQAPLRNRFRDLPEADIKEILYQRMWEFDSYKSHEDHMQLFEALEKSMNHLDMDEAMGPNEQAQLSNYKDIGSAHILTVNLRQGWWKTFEEERPTTPEPACKGHRPALFISKIKAAYYPDDGIEQMVPDQFWIEEECKYDIAAMYDQEGRRSVQRVHVRDSEAFEDTEDLPQLGELCWRTRILTVAAAGQKDVNSQLHVHTSNSLSMTAKRPTT